MEHNVTALKNNRWTSILGMGVITIFMLAIFLAWGHLQGKSHEIINLYLASCQGLEQGISSLLTICKSDLFTCR